MDPLKRLARRIRDFALAPVLDPSSGGAQGAGAVAQLQLELTYRALKQAGARLPTLDQVGFKAFSQTDEDGILLYIFSIIGAKTRTCVEICAGDGIACNTANLVINHGWDGLLVDGNADLVKRGIEFYTRHTNTCVYPPRFVHAWVTRDNVNQIITSNGFRGEVDLLSVDMDGVDYWIWSAIDSIEPRVVVVEYQDIIGPQRALTVPYCDDFDARAYPTTRGTPNFCGASLPAFLKLARQRGYRLVGSNRYGFNAFFIKNPSGQLEIPEIDIEDCFRHSKVLSGMKERFPTVKDHPWVEV